MHTYFSFGLILQDIPNSITPQTTLHLLPIPVGTPRTPLYPPVKAVPPLLPSPFFSPVPDRGTGESGTCARDRHALQQLALNVHVKHSDLT